MHKSRAPAVQFKKKLNNHHGLVSGAISLLRGISLHSVNLATMKHVTGNFSDSNIIHQDEGGVCVVYKVSPFSW
jgi:hypothetical protein